MDDILEYSNMVYSIVKKYSNYYDKEDLYQAGMLGLINAYKNFDQEKNTKFSTYAYIYIKGKVIKFINESKNIKINRDLVKLNSSLIRAKDVLRQRLLREPTDFELSIFLEIDESQIRDANIAYKDVKSLDSLIELDEESCVNLYNSIKVEDKNLKSEYIDLKTEIKNLEREEQDIIINHYYKDLTQSEISNKLGINQVQVSRKEKKILQKLKTRL